MTAKHTPGPWHIDASKSFYVFASGALAEQAGVEHGPFICNASTQANAALIASAPDLLAERDRLLQVNAELLVALKGIIRHLGPFMGQGCMDSEIAVARAAIAKAEESAA